MERIVIQGRPDKAQKLEEIGLSFHGWDGYWNEDVCYKFTAQQIDVIEEATNKLHSMCLQVVEHIIKHNRFEDLKIPRIFWEPIKRSWKRGDMTLYGRFDLAYDGVNPPKMLEYNADTPTSLLESAVAQWYWLGDVKPQCDQFNSIHERLRDRWKQMFPANVEKIHFASISENEEDWVCTHYLMETALQAGYKVEHIFIENIGWDPEAKVFFDENNKEIQALFKLYPWEWMMTEEFGPNVIESKTHFVEPLWKSLLSNKAILAILWELFPCHENLLQAHLDTPLGMTSYAKKPLFSREGANIELFENGAKVAEDEGPYGQEGHVYQELVKLPEFKYTDYEGKPQTAYPVIGSWIIGDEASGMCVREDVLRITTNMSNFIPHYFE